MKAREQASFAVDFIRGLTGERERAAGLVELRNRPLLRRNGVVVGRMTPQSALDVERKERRLPDILQASILILPPVESGRS